MSFMSKDINILTIENVYHISFKWKIKKTCVLKICTKFTAQHPCRSAISRKFLCNFIEITFRHVCSPVNLFYIFRTPFPTNTSGWLLLTMTIFIWSWNTGIVFHFSRDAALNFSKPLKQINKSMLLVTLKWAYWHFCDSGGYTILLMKVHTLFS